MAPSPITPGRLSVLHLIETFGRGGAEVLLAQALPVLNRHVDVRIRALGPPGTLLGELTAGGLDAATYGSRPTTDLDLRDLSRRLGAELAARPVDILHTHLFKATMVGRMARFALGLRRPPRLLTTLHNPDYSHPESLSRIRGLARQIVDWGSAVAANDCLIAVSEAVAADFRHHMGPIGPWGHIEVIHNALDIDRYVDQCARVDRVSARRAWGWAPDEFAVLSIGRLTNQKHYDSLIEAVTQLRSRGVNARAVVIGDGVERPRLERLAHDGVRFHGRAAPEAVVEALVACDVYVQPSRWEAFGIAILEAMAASRPVVATSVNGIREVVADGDTGMLVPPAQAGALADALQSLSRDPERAARWGAAGRLRARQRFSLDTWVDQTVSLYHRCR